MNLSWLRLSALCWSENRYLAEGNTESYEAHAGNIHAWDSQTQPGRFTSGNFLSFRWLNIKKGFYLHSLKLTPGLIDHE